MHPCTKQTKNVDYDIQRRDSAWIISLSLSLRHQRSRRPLLQHLADDRKLTPRFLRDRRLLMRGRVTHRIIRAHVKPTQPGGLYLSSRHTSTLHKLAAVRITAQQVLVKASYVARVGRILRAARAGLPAGRPAVLLYRLIQYTLLARRVDRLY